MSSNRSCRSQHNTSQEDFVKAMIAHNSLYTDPYLKGVIAAMGRSVFRNAKFAKQFKLRMAFNGHREQQAERFRYYLATREAMAAGTTFALSVDASRKSGVEYQIGPILNVETQTCAWMPPVAPQLQLQTNEALCARQMCMHAVFSELWSVTSQNLACSFLRSTLFRETLVVFRYCVSCVSTTQKLYRCTFIKKNPRVSPSI